MPVAAPGETIVPVYLPLLWEHRTMGLWMTAREAFGVALKELATHKLRSFLTLLGVVISTATLIVVMSIVNGMNLYIADHVANLGTNTFVLHQFQWAQGFEKYLQARRRNQPIRLEDYEFLEENLHGYQHIGALAQLTPGPRARYETRLIDEIELKAVTSGFIDVGREKLPMGDTSTMRTMSTRPTSVLLARTWLTSFFLSSIRSARRFWWRAFRSASLA